MLRDIDHESIRGANHVTLRDPFGEEQSSVPQATWLGPDGDSNEVTDPDDECVLGGRGRRNENDGDGEGDREWSAAHGP